MSGSPETFAVMRFFFLIRSSFFPSWTWLDSTEYLLWLQLGAFSTFGREGSFEARPDLLLRILIGYTQDPRMIDRSVRSMINDRDYEGADVGDHRPYPRTVYAIHYPGRQKRKKKEREKNTKRGRGGRGTFQWLRPDGVALLRSPWSRGCIRINIDVPGPQDRGIMPEGPLAAITHRPSSVVSVRHRVLHGTPDIRIKKQRFFCSAFLIKPQLGPHTIVNRGVNPWWRSGGSVPQPVVHRFCIDRQFEERNDKLIYSDTGDIFIKTTKGKVFWSHNRK